MSSITGVIRWFAFLKRDSRFAEIRIRDDDTFYVGTIPPDIHPLISETVLLEGVVSKSPYNGKTQKSFRQIDIVAREQSFEEMAVTEDVTKDLLCSNIPNFGPASAKILFARYGEDSIKNVVRLIKNEVSADDFFDGVAVRQAQKTAMIESLPALGKILNSDDKMQALSALTALGFPLAVVQKTISTFGDACTALQMVQADPYVMLKVKGVKFTDVDSVVIKSHLMEIDDTRRVRGIVYAALKGIKAANFNSNVCEDAEEVLEYVQKNGYSQHGPLGHVLSLIHI